MDKIDYLSDVERDIAYIKGKLVSFKTQGGLDSGFIPEKSHCIDRTFWNLNKATENVEELLKIVRKEKRNELA